MLIVRVATVYDPDVDALPPEFRSVLTDQDVTAIRTGPAYFATLARPDLPGWLNEVLARCAGAPFDLQFYTAGDAPYRPFFRSFWGEFPAVALPRPGELRPDVPPFLRGVYGVLGTFRENEFDTAGGLLPGDSLEPMSEKGVWVEPGWPIDPAAAVPFLVTLSGSELCYLPDGSGAWLKAGRFHRVDDLEQEVARYFEALLQGKRI